MTHWNYRVIKKEYINAHMKEPETYYEIHEVYYENDQIVSWSAESVGLYGESIGDLREVLSMIMTATAKPVLKNVNGKLVEVK